MKVSLPYRKTSIDIEIPEERILAILEPNETKADVDAEKAVLRALASPSGCRSYENFISGDEKLLVIVNDGTRSTPTSEVLAVIADELEAANTGFIVATGAHRGPTEDELRAIFGDNLERFRDRISVHDARTGNMYRLGTTSRETEVILNAEVMASGRLLIIGSVEPHYFAGWSGGRKGLVPGLAGYTTIEENHKHALSPDAQLFALEGNPVHEDMIEACEMLDKDIFSIMTVLDCEQNLYAVTAGDLNSAFEEAVVLATAVYAVPLEAKADVVIACAKHPMDIDLYQSHKAIEHAKIALKPGGTLILVSSCRDGIGEDSFVSLLSSCRSAEAVYAKIAEGYRLGYHKAAKIAELCANARVLAYTELNDSAFHGIFIEPVVDLQKALEQAFYNPGAQVVIMPDATVTVPMV